MKYFSMFSGIGGFELGIQHAFNFDKGLVATGTPPASFTLPANKTANEPLLCIGFSEIDKHAISIYEQKFKGHKNYGDATRIVPEELPDFDFLCGGFPCQAFSIAGKRLGFNETRGTLFFDIARILKVKKPRMFLLENVKGLLSHDNGRTFKTIVATLVELGYCVEWQILNSKNHGVPQNRERVFIVGHFGNECPRQVFPIGEVHQLLKAKNRTDEGRSQTEISHTLKGANMKADNLFIKETQRLSDSQRVRETDGDACTLKGLGGGAGAKTGLYRIEGEQIRRLTPTECERLQGFPDGWTAGLPDTHRYKCLGNAVTVNVIQAIIERIFFEV